MIVIAILIVVVIIVVIVVVIVNVITNLAGVIINGSLVDNRVRQRHYVATRNIVCIT